MNTDNADDSAMNSGWTELCACMEPIDFNEALHRHRSFGLGSEGLGCNPFGARPILVSLLLLQLSG